LNGVVPAQDESPDKKKIPPRYVGIKGCKKCHQKASIGRQFKAWEGMKHAKALETLKSDQAIEVAKKLGLKNKPSEEPNCLKCHTTAYGLPKTHYGEKFSLEEGVTCEACHGASEFFDKPEDEKQHKEAYGKGYITPDEKLCRSCHNEESPTWDPERDTTKDGKKVGFDYESRLKQISHPIPKKDTKEGGN
jgi:hypothetical protein